jgi:hypothetical protein
MNEAEKQVVEEDKKAFWMVQATTFRPCPGLKIELSEASTAEAAVAFYAKYWKLPAETLIDVQLVAPIRSMRVSGVSC